MTRERRPSDADLAREANRHVGGGSFSPPGALLRRAVLGHAGRFDCGVRVVDGGVSGGGRRWKHRVSRIESDVLHHGSAALRLELGQQIRHPGGLGASRRCVVWTASAPDLGAEVQLAFLPAVADAVLGSRLSGGRMLRLDPHIEDL